MQTKMRQMRQICSCPMRHLFILAIALFCLSSCSNEEREKVVVCIPVYGQSLALGEDAELITDIENLTEKSNGRIVSEGLGCKFGYYEDHGSKQWAKRVLRYNKRRFENSAYSMAETLTDNLGEDTIVCTFAGGRGGTAISNLIKGTYPYQRFLENIKVSYEKAVKKGWKFYVPAICWMQGESDMFDYTRVDYKKLLKQFSLDINKDIKAITRQEQEVRIICYQTCCLSICWNYNPNNYDCYEASIAESQMELIRDDSLFEAGTPVYPFNFIKERLHLDGEGQRCVGKLHAQTALDIIRTGHSARGLYPVKVLPMDAAVVVGFNKRIQVDTCNVTKARNYGFSVITPQGKDIAMQVALRDSSVVISCTQPTNGCRVRYGVNGTQGRTGLTSGPRGNIKSADKGDDKAEWCYIFNL